jgi:hypothetical protein
MRGALNQRSIHGGDIPDCMALDQTARGLGDDQILVWIDLASEPMASPTEQGSEIARAEHDGPWRLEGCGAEAIVAMQTPEALQEHIGRAQIRDYQIGVNVEALL